MRYYFENVSRFGNIALSRHAQRRMRDSGISESMFIRILSNGTLKEDGLNVIWCDHEGIRVVIVKRPTPFAGAALVATVYRIAEQARMRRR